jgi:hypothetical protein
MRATNGLVGYMKEFHGPAWSRLNRRFIGIGGIIPVRSRRPFYSPRKGWALQEIVWCWRRPLRHQKLDAMIVNVRTLQVIGGIAVGLSLAAFGFLDPNT